MPARPRLRARSRTATTPTRPRRYRRLAPRPLAPPLSDPRPRSLPADPDRDGQVGGDPDNDEDDFIAAERTVSVEIVVPPSPPADRIARVRLKALRGAITVEDNEAEAILGATEELVRERARAQRAPGRGPGELHLHLHRRPRRRLPRRGGPAPRAERRPAAVRREIDVPGALPRVIRLMVHCYAGGRAAQHVYLREADPAAPGPPGRPVTPIEFNRRVEAIPVYPAAETYEYDGELVKLASNETPWGPSPEVLEAPPGSALRGLNRYPDPEKSLLRRRIAERCDVSPAMVAVGNGSCEILLAAAEAMLEPGAEIVYAWPSFSMYPHLAAMTRRERRSRCRWTPRAAHDLEAMAREVTHATRIVVICNPNNPTATGAAPGGDRRLRRRAAATRRRDRGRGLRRVLARSQDPDESLDLRAAPPQPGPAAHVLEGVRPLRPAGRLRDRARELPAGGRPRAAAVLGQRAGPGGRGRGAPAPGRGGAAGRADGDRAPVRGVRARASAASRPPTARRTSPGSGSATATRPRWCAAWPSAA